MLHAKRLREDGRRLFKTFMSHGSNVQYDMGLNVVAHQRDRRDDDSQVTNYAECDPSPGDYLESSYTGVHYTYYTLCSTR